MRKNPLPPLSPSRTQTITQDDDFTPLQYKIQLIEKARKCQTQVELNTFLKKLEKIYNHDDAILQKVLQANHLISDDLNERQLRNDSVSKDIAKLASNVSYLQLLGSPVIKEKIIRLTNSTNDLEKQIEAFGPNQIRTKTCDILSKDMSIAKTFLHLTNHNFELLEKLAYLSHRRIIDFDSSEEINNEIRAQYGSTQKLYEEYERLCEENKLLREEESQYFHDIFVKRLQMNANSPVGIRSVADTLQQMLFSYHPKENRQFLSVDRFLPNEKIDEQDIDTNALYEQCEQLEEQINAIPLPSGTEKEVNQIEKYFETLSNLNEQLSYLNQDVCELESDIIKVIKDRAIASEKIDFAAKELNTLVPLHSRLKKDLLSNSLVSETLFDAANELGKSIVNPKDAFLFLNKDEDESFLTRPLSVRAHCDQNAAFYLSALEKCHQIWNEIPSSYVSEKCKSSLSVLKDMVDKELVDWHQYSSNYIETIQAIYRPMLVKEHQTSGCQASLLHFDTKESQVDALPSKK